MNELVIRLHPGSMENVHFGELCKYRKVKCYRNIMFTVLTAHLVPVPSLHLNTPLALIS